MTGLRIGSLCTGYGGLDMAVRAVFGGGLAWVADPDPGAAAILAHHHPRVPNLGDITAVDWRSVPAVDVVTGGYPCQPFSSAGKRRGTADVRHIWPHVARALGVLRPRFAVFENVENHLRLGFDTVLADLAGLGFDAEWCLVRASEVGAPHRRTRLFVLAWPADTPGPRLEGGGLPGRTAERGAGPVADATDLGRERGGRARDGRAGPAHGGGPAADTEGDAGRRLATGGRDAVRHGLRPGTDRRGTPAAHTTSERWGARGTEPARQQRGPDPALGGGTHWGIYAPAIARWEAIQDRRAPGPVDDRGRLTPAFVEWDMGLPAGHVTDPAIWQSWKPAKARNAQLKALGNGVIPAQGAAAVRLLADRASITPTQAGRGEPGAAA